MADNITAPAEGAVLATDEIAGIHYPRTKISFGADGAAVDVSSSDPFPVTGPLTDTQLRATALPVSVTFPATQPVSGNVGVTGSVAVTGPLTDAQLRATALPVSGNVGVTGSVAVTGPLTDTQLRATALPVSAASLPLPAGAATSANQATVIAALANLLTTAGFEARIPSLGTKAASGSVSTTPSSDQDPIFDHTNAVKATVTTTSATAITPPAGCKYLRVHATADMFLRTDAGTAADAAGSIKLIANQVETIPVVAGTAVTAVVLTGTASLYATPMKVR